MPSTKYLLLAFAALTLACGGSDGDSTSKNDAGKNRKDASAGSKADRDSGSADDDDSDDDDTDGDGDDDTPSSGKNDAGGGSPSGKPDGGGFAPVDAAALPLNDAGVLQGSGSCCTEHDTPGCNNADLMVCVCELDPTCCTTAWGKQCAFIVEGKYCQDGVRDCVCGTGDGQWGQTKCCDTEWSSTCDTVAKNKCEAVPGCF